MTSLHIRFLGRAPYAETWEAQLALCEVKREDPSLPDELWLMEHEPVYTIGRTPDRSSLNDPAGLPFPVFEINRGGQATFHGPGQLVGYPILDLRGRGRDLHRHLRDIEEGLIALLARFGVAGSRREGLTGVWVGEKKIASLGVGVRHWISMHGFALNVCNDLAPFRMITPCGLAGVEMTSVAAESGRAVSVGEIAAACAGTFAAAFGYGEILRSGEPLPASSPDPG